MTLEEIEREGGIKAMINKTNEPDKNVKIDL